MKWHIRILLLLRHTRPCMRARQQPESLENQVSLCVRMEKKEEEGEKEEVEEEAHKRR